MDTSKGIILLKEKEKKENVNKTIKFCQSMSKYAIFHKESFGFPGNTWDFDQELKQRWDVVYFSSKSEGLDTTSQLEMNQSAKLRSEPESRCYHIKSRGQLASHVIFPKSTAIFSSTNDSPCVLSAKAWSSKLNSEWDVRWSILLFGRTVQATFRNLCVIGAILWHSDNDAPRNHTQCFKLFLIWNSR